jgi:acyl-CoA thioesterase I
VVTSRQFGQGLKTLNFTKQKTLVAGALMAACAVVFPGSAQALETTELACKTYSDLNVSKYNLSNVARALDNGDPVKIVTMGSSSTSGAGAQFKRGDYPSQLENQLTKDLVAPFFVVNSGKGGDTIVEMLERFQKDVIDHKPHLVVLQVGTNTLLREASVDDAKLKIKIALEWLKEQSIDVIIMDAQFAPKVLAKPDAPRMVQLLADLADEYKLPLYSRFAQMQRWFEREKIPFSFTLSEDGLHMNDWSYKCVAQQLAQLIARNSVVRYFQAEKLRLNHR